MSKIHVQMTVNGEAVEALVEPRTLLIHFIREELMLTGAHIGCDTTHCGACTVDLDGRSVNPARSSWSRRTAPRSRPSRAWRSRWDMHALQEAFA